MKQVKQKDETLIVNAKDLMRKCEILSSEYKIDAARENNWRGRARK